MELCREKHYPYPDENVFLIAGARSDLPLVDLLKAKPMVVVSRQADRAMRYFENMGGSQSWEALGCLSLAQARALRSAMAGAATSQSGVKEIQAGAISSVIGKRQPWAIAQIDEAGHPLDPEMVMAMSSADVFAYTKAQGSKAVGIFSLEMLDEIIANMDEVKHGRAKNIDYATDLQGGELEEELAAEVASWTDEEREEEELAFKRAQDKRAMGLI